MTRQTSTNTSWSSASSASTSSTATATRTARTGGGGGERAWLAERSASSMAAGVTEKRLDNLKWWNVALAALHFVQAVVVVALGHGFTIDVTRSFPRGPPGSLLPAPQKLFAVDIGVMIGAFLVLASVDHGLMATVLRERYERGLADGINVFRWLEYSVSASIMMVIIAMYAGIVSFVALVNIAGANTVMILCGWLMERVNPPSRTSTLWLPFTVGCIAGAAPWIAVWFQIFGTADNVPAFVFAIVVTQVVLFSTFGLNQLLQYARYRAWADYAFGEKTYLVLSLVAKSLLAWLVFGGSLSDGGDDS